MAAPDSNNPKTGNNFSIGSPEDFFSFKEGCTNISEDSLTHLIKVINETKDPTNQAIAVIFASHGFRVFPLEAGKKTPLVDPALGLTHGLNDAASDPRLAARIWHKHSEAGIGLALPQGLIVIDCDVQKDPRTKQPILDAEGNPNQLGLDSLQNFILNQCKGEPRISTLRIKTQSGGFQFFYSLKAEQLKVLENRSMQFTNRTNLFDHLDIKTIGGYVILPPSRGPFGKYSFASLIEIADLPACIFNTMLENYAASPAEVGPRESLELESDKLLSLVDLLLPIWAKADGRRNDLTLSIDGALAKAGISREKRSAIIKELCKRTGKGCDHISAVGYADKKIQAGQKVMGFGTLERLIDEMEGEISQ